MKMRRNAKIRKPAPLERGETQRETYDLACGITGIPIRDGDEAIVFVIEPCATLAPLKSDIQTQSDGIYRPVSLPIRAMYMDCGNFEPILDGVDRAAEFVAAANAVLTKRGLQKLADWQDFIEKTREGFAFPGEEMSGGILSKNLRAFHLYAVHIDIFETMLRSGLGQGRLDRHLRHCNEIELPEKRDRLARFSNEGGPAKFASAKQELLESMAREIAGTFEQSEVPHLRIVSLCNAMIPVAKSALEGTFGAIAFEEIPVALRELVVFQHALSNMNRGFAPAFKTEGDFDHVLADDLDRVTRQLLQMQRAEFGIDLDQEPDEPEAKDEPDHRDDDDKPL